MLLGRDMVGLSTARSTTVRYEPVQETAVVPGPLWIRNGIRYSVVQILYIVGTKAVHIVYNMVQN